MGGARRLALGAALGAMVTGAACGAFDAAAVEGDVPAEAGVPSEAGALPDAAAGDDATPPPDAPSDACEAAEPSLGSNVAKIDGPLEPDPLGPSASDAYGYEALVAAPVEARCAHVYVHMMSGASENVQVGVYEDAPGRPGGLLSRARFAARLGWNHVLLDRRVKIAPGTRLWIAVLTEVDRIEIVIQRTCAAGWNNPWVRRSPGGPLGSLPDPFNGDLLAFACNAAFYLSP
jgi:hypothetical protein